MAKFSFTIKHSVTPQQFRQIVDDQRFYQLRFDRLKAEVVSLERECVKGVSTILASIKPDKSILPGSVRSFVSGDFVVTIRDEWSPMMGPTCQATSLLTTTAAPITVGYSQIVEQFGDECRRSVEGDVSVTNDVMGLMARSVTKHLDHLRRFEEQTMVHYLDKYGVPQE